MITCSRILKLRQGLYRAMKAQITCFTSFIKLLFSILTKKRQYTYTKHLCALQFPSCNCKFSQLGDSQTYCSLHFHSFMTKFISQLSHSLMRANHRSQQKKLVRTFLLVPAAKRGTSLGLPRVFFYLCRDLQPLDVILDILDSD